MSEDSNLIQDSFGIMVRKATEGVEEGVKGKAVAGNKKIFLYNIQSKLSSLDEAEAWPRSSSRGSKSMPTACRSFSRMFAAWAPANSANEERSATTLSAEHEDKNNAKMGRE